MIMKLFQGVLDGKEILDEWQTSLLVSVFKGKDEVRKCSAWRRVKLLVYAMKIVERKLEGRI